MSYFLGTLAVIAVAALILWLFSYGLGVLMPLILAGAVFVILKTVVECVDPKFGRVFEGVVGGALFVVILGVILL